MRKLSGAFLFLAMSASAHTLHYGDYSVELTNTKQTTPSLNVQLNDGIYYAAMYADNAIPNTIKINYNDKVYWLGCPAGMYRPDGATKCVDCGLGHYCMGGNHRASCTGGAIACNGTNATSDAVADANLMNRVLSLDEVTTHIPQTDFSQWELVTCDTGDYKYQNLPFAPENSPDCGYTITLGVGTYLFTTRSDGFCTGVTDIITGRLNFSSSFNIAVFDRPVGYKGLFVTNYFYSYIDIAHAEYQSASYHIPSDFYCENRNKTNVTNLANSPVGHICVYKLK